MWENSEGKWFIYSNTVGTSSPLATRVFIVEFFSEREDRTGVSPKVTAIVVYENPNRINEFYEHTELQLGNYRPYQPTPKDLHAAFKTLFEGRYEIGK
jgi:hypothetical protein